MRLNTNSIKAITAAIIVCIAVAAVIIWRIQTPCYQIHVGEKTITQRFAKDSRQTQQDIINTIAPLIAKLQPGESSPTFTCVYSYDIKGEIPIPPNGIPYKGRVEHQLASFHAQRENDECISFHLHPGKDKAPIRHEITIKPTSDEIKIHLERVLLRQDIIEANFMPKPPRAA